MLHGVNDLCTAPEILTVKTKLRILDLWGAFYPGPDFARPYGPTDWTNDVTALKGELSWTFRVNLIKKD